MIIKPYSGTDDYIFISYAHKDSELVFPIIEQMQRDRYNVWFDEGIDPGTEWPKTVADRLYHCAFFIALMSENYLTSTNCIDELEFARNKEKSRVILYLQDIALPIDVELRHGRIQAIFWFKYTEKAEAFKKLYSAKGIATSRHRDESNDIDSDSELKKNSQSSELSDGQDAVNKSISLRTVSNADDLPPTPDGAFRFSLDDNGWTISLCDKKYTEIKIPEKYQGKPVTTIGDMAFLGCDSLTDITIPSSVTTIGDSAFWGCNSLTNITIPSSVTTIGDSAFWGCDSLTEITIPSSVTTIGNSAFSLCDSLTNITIPSSVTTIGDEVFMGCKHLTNVTIPSEIRVFGAGVFDLCRKLKNLRIRDSDKEIQMTLREFFQKMERCSFCGGSFKKGLFSTKCTHCGEKKDY